MSNQARFSYYRCWLSVRINNRLNAADDDYDETRSAGVFTGAFIQTRTAKIPENKYSRKIGCWPTSTVNYWRKDNHARRFSNTSEGSITVWHARSAHQSTASNGLSHARSRRRAGRHTSTAGGHQPLWQVLTPSRPPPPSFPPGSL